MKKSVAVLSFCAALAGAAVGAFAQGVSQTSPSARPMVSHEMMEQYPELSHAIQALQGAKNSIGLMPNKGDEHNVRALQHIDSALDELLKELPQAPTK